MNYELKQKSDEHKLDLEFLNEFFLKKGDSLLSILLFKEQLISLDTEKTIEYLSNDGALLEGVPEHLRDYSLCEKAVSNDGMALEFVPYKHKDYSLCEKAVSNDGMALNFVPKYYIGKNLKTGYFGSILFKDYPLCEKAVSNNGRALQYVPKELIDYSLCEKAVSNDGMSLQYVPVELKDYSLYEKAISQNGGSLYFVPVELRDYSLCKKAVSQNAWALDNVPKDIENYYSLVKIAYQKSKESVSIIERNWFPKEYIPQLMKDFPQDSELKKYLLQENIRKHVRKLLREYYLQ